MFVGVLVGVLVCVICGVLVLVGVILGVLEGVVCGVAVFVGVLVLVGVDVFVGVKVGVGVILHNPLSVILKLPPLPLTEPKQAHMVILVLATLCEPEVPSQLVQVNKVGSPDGKNVFKSV